MNDIQRTSRRFRLFFLIIFYSMPVILAVIWFGCDFLLREILFMMPAFPDQCVPWPLPLMPRLLGFVSCLPSTFMNMAAFAYLARLFGMFGRGEFFTTPAVRTIRRIGWILLLAQGVAFLHVPLLSLALTAANPPGQHVITLSLSSGMVTQVIIGLIIILVSKIMDEGRKLSEEQAYVI